MKEQNLNETPNSALNIAVSRSFSKEDLWDAWWASAIKTISFSGVDKDYERRCFEKFYENKLAYFVDAVRLDNLTDTIDLTERLIEDIIMVARHKDRVEFSMKTAGEKADNFISGLRGRLNPEPMFSEHEISQLQSKIHAITGDGEVMMLFNEMLGINAGS
jgi:hypothetical protein